MHVLTKLLFLRISMSIFAAQEITKKKKKRGKGKGTEEGKEKEREKKGKGTGSELKKWKRRINDGEKCRC